MVFDSSTKQRCQATEMKREEVCLCQLHKSKKTSKKNRHRCKCKCPANHSSDNSVSDSDSSGEITININLNKSTLLSKKSKNREATINIQTVLQESEEDPKNPVSIVKTRTIESTPILRLFHLTPQAESLEHATLPPPQINPPVLTKVPEILMNEKKEPEVEAKIVTSKPQVDLSGLSLGVKLLESTKTLTVKPKAAKTYSSIDKMLYDLIVQLTNKSITDEIKADSIKKFEAQSTRKFFKVMLTPKGREQDLVTTNEAISKLKSSAIKLYTIENDQKPLVGAVVWEEEGQIAWIDREIFKVDLLNFSNPEDEKEIVKALKLCLKTKELEI